MAVDPKRMQSTYEMLGGDLGGADAGVTYNAACSDCPSDGVTGGWIGPKRATKTEAEADAAKHNKTHPGHTAGVL